MSRRKIIDALNEAMTGQYAEEIVRCIATEALVKELFRRNVVLEACSQREVSAAYAYAMGSEGLARFLDHERQAMARELGSAALERGFIAFETCPVDPVVFGTQSATRARVRFIDPKFWFQPQESKTNVPE